MKKICSVMTCEYCDLDAYLNVKLFYESAGYRVLKDKKLRNADLLVVLRGDKEISDHEYTGIVHAYDYVREYKIDWKARFPKARRIFVISPTPPDCPDSITYVKGYLPVIPELWQSPLKEKDVRPMHISHFKPMAQDKYQQELLKLIKSGIVRVYGKKWDKVGIKAKPLSYWQVNKMFAASSTCYGLMYPYQRGKTLSGRMWQAPLHGCFVISEAGTNIAGCPGVIEVSSFSAGNFTALDYSIEQCRSLAIDAARHWRTATQKLAEELGQVLEIAKQFNQNISEGRLGGYTRTSDIFPHGDPNTWCPELWKWAHDTLCIRSVLDVGCGEGHSAAYFKEIGCDVLGVDGSIEAKKSSRIPQFHVIHDFENGPFIPNKAYDLIWSCEFVEHVSEDKVNNIMKTFGYGKKYIMMSYAEPGQAGWHHVNCKPEEYWIKKILGIGFRIDLRLTKTGRRMAGAGHFAEKGLIFRRSNTIMRFIAFCYYRFSGI